MSDNEIKEQNNIPEENKTITQTKEDSITEQSPKKQLKEKKRKERDSSRSRSRSRSYSVEERRKNKKKKKKHHHRSYSSSSRSRSPSKKKSSRGKHKKHSKKKDKKSRRTRSKSKERRRTRTRTKSKSPPKIQKENESKFFNHYKNLIKGKSDNNNPIQAHKFENAGLYWDGFHWISPDIQNHKQVRSVTIYGLPLDQCMFTNQQLSQFLTIYMIENKLADSGNEFPISSCIINQENTTASIEFSTIEECQRFSILNKIPILNKDCKIVKQHDSNPYNQTQGLEQAQMAAKAQAAAMQAMVLLKDDIITQKKEKYQAKKEAKLEAKQEQNEQQQQQQQQQQEEGQQEAIVPNLPPLPVEISNNQNNVEQNNSNNNVLPPPNLPPLPF